jgi:hypothetical protein
MTDKPRTSTENSIRSNARRGAAAAGIAAFGLGGAAVAGAQDDDEEVVVFGDDYVAGLEFDVVSELEGQTLTNVIESATAGTDQVMFEEPDDWDGYLVQYDLDDDFGPLGLLFTDSVDLSPGDSETLSDDGAFRNSRLNLVEVDLD